MSKKHPEYTWIRLNVLDPPFFCPKHEIKLKMYSFQLTGETNDNDQPRILDTWICPNEECSNKITVESFWKRLPKKAKPTKDKKQRKLI